MNAAIATPVIEAQGLWKRFGGRQVVSDFSLALGPGEILGLLGPNGSGKTTSIRMLLGILRPDQGHVRFGTSEPAATDASRIGYLPEERGLYQSQQVAPTLHYLGSLRGMSAEEARVKTAVVLERLGMAEHATKRVRELSRGMGQLVQLAAALLHGPELIVLDEPFAGLDPVNVRLMKDVVAERRSEGAAIMFSTHRMPDVEELCDRIIMIDHGDRVLEGCVDEVRERYATGALFIDGSHPPEGLESIRTIEPLGDGYLIQPADGAEPERVLAELLAAGVRVRRFEIALPSLEEVFIRVAGGGHA